MRLTVRPCRTSGADDRRRPVVDDGDGDERQPQTEGEAARRTVPCRTVPLLTAIARMPLRMIPMHGVQPTAKIAPEAERREPAAAAGRPPGRRVDRRSTGRRSRRPGSPRATLPVAVARLPAAPASSGRQVRSRTGMRRMPARLRPITMSMTPADHAQRRQVVDEPAGRERGRRAEHREHRPEPEDVGDGVADGQPARGPVRLPSAGAGDGHRRQLAEVGRHEREDARRQEADDAGQDGDEDREVGAAGHARDAVQLRRPGGDGAWPGWSRSRGGGRRAPRPGSRSK